MLWHWHLSTMTYPFNVLFTQHSIVTATNSLRATPYSLKSGFKGLIWCHGGIRYLSKLKSHWLKEAVLWLLLFGGCSLVALFCSTVGHPWDPFRHQGDWAALEHGSIASDLYPDSIGPCHGTPKAHCEVWPKSVLQGGGVNLHFFKMKFSRLIVLQGF